MKQLYNYLANKKDIEAINMPPARIRSIRALYGLRRKPFAELIKVNIFTLKSWENGYRFPSSPGIAILLVAENNPDVFLEHRDEIFSEINKRYG